MIDLDAPDLRFDARLSPAQAIPPAALDAGRGTHTGSGKPRPGPWVYDALLFYLSASDRVVSSTISRALVEVRDGKLYKREGHARWSEYLRAFVPMTQRWCQDEMKRERRLEGLPAVAAAAEMMAAETFSGMSQWRDTGACEEAGGKEPGQEAVGKKDSPAGSILGDHDVLVRELGRGWADLHEHMETISKGWSGLPWEIPQVILEGAPGDDAGAHERVVFWTGVQARLDAVRGRLLRIMQDRMLAERMWFASVGQYARERLGLTAREAEDLIRLDRELSDLPVTFKMYAAGRLGRSKAREVARAVRLWGTGRTERAWVSYALTHSRRLLEAAVEAVVLLKQADPARWRESKGLPPVGASFAEVLRMCSLFETTDTEQEPLARIEMRFHPLQKVGYEATVEALRNRYGQDRPEWWCLGVMARHFLEMYAAADDEVKRSLARQVIQRDGYTCSAPECLMRVGLEADHIRLRSRGGPTTPGNMTALCVAHHRYHKHALGSLVLSGEAPDALTVKLGGRLYQKDELLYPKLDEAELDKDPWKIGEPVVVSWRASSWGAS